MALSKGRPRGIGAGDEDVVVLRLYLAERKSDSAKPVICDDPQ